MKNNTSKVVTGAIKKSELVEVAKKYNIGDLITRYTQDGVKVKCPIVKKHKNFCLVQTAGKTEAVLWVDLITG